MTEFFVERADKKAASMPTVIVSDEPNPFNLRIDGPDETMVTLTKADFESKRVHLYLNRPSFTIGTLYLSDVTNGYPYIDQLCRKANKIVFQLKEDLLSSEVDEFLRLVLPSAFITAARIKGKKVGSLDANGDLWSNRGAGGLLHEVW